MESSFYVKYNSNNAYSIAWLWQSLIGLEKNIQSAIKMYWIDSTVDLKIKKVTEWSIIFDIMVNLLANNYVEVFDNLVEPFLKFLLVADRNTYNTIIQGMSENALSWYNSLEEFFASHPMAYDGTKLIAKGIINFFLVSQAINWVEININAPLINLWTNITITSEQAKYIKKEIEKWSFNDLLLPITEDNIEKIEFWIEENENRIPEFEINDQNFENYMWDWKEILSDFENWEEYTLTGKITSMQVNRWESMNYHIEKDWKEYNLVLLPQDWDNVDNYKMYFNQNIVIRAEVVRTSLYKKPKIVLKQLQNATVPLGL